MQIHVDINTKKTSAFLKRLQKRVGNMRPFFVDAGEILVDEIEQNFEAQGRPSWTPSLRVQREGGETLSKTGRLRRSFTPKATGTYAKVGTNVKYAAALNFGARIGPHIIRPKHGQALMWPGAAHPVKLVRHPGATIPAREFMSIPASGFKRIELAALRHLERGN